MKINKTNIIQIIGFLYIASLMFAAVFLDRTEIEKTFWANGLLAIIAVFMAGYGIDYKNKSLKEKLFKTFKIIILGGTLLYYWYT